MLFGILPALRLLERARHVLVGEFRHRFILSFRLVIKSFYDESVELRTVVTLPSCPQLSLPDLRNSVRIAVCARSAAFASKGR